MILKTALLTALLSLSVIAEEEKPPQAPIFKDKNLEAAVRYFVLEKRNSEEPLTKSDLVNLSTIEAKNRNITDLSGLELCENLASRMWPTTRSPTWAPSRT